MFQVQQSALFYHLGVRESFGMKQNVLLYQDLDKEATLGLKISMDRYSIVAYHQGDDGKLLVSESQCDRQTSGFSGNQPLVHKLNQLLKELVVSKKDYSNTSIYIIVLNLTIYMSWLKCSFIKVTENNPILIYSILQIQSKEHLKEKFKADLTKCRDQYSGQELQDQLRKMKRRLDDPNVLSGDVIHNMLISFREIQVCCVPH